MFGRDGLSSVGDADADTVGVGSGVTDGLLSTLGCVDTSTEAQDESIINTRMKGANRLISLIHISQSYIGLFILFKKQIEITTTRISRAKKATSLRLI